MRSSKPKVLHEFAGKTFLQRVMASVGHLEPETLAVVVHYQADRVSEAARSYDANVDIVNQDDIPGTGRAVQCAMAQLTQERNLHGSVLIAASDMPLLDSVTLKKLVAFHEQSGDGATVLTTILDNPTGYGRIIRDRDGHVLRIVEQKDANRSELAVQEVNTSVYVFDADLLAEAIANLDNHNAQGEFYLTDALETAKTRGTVGAFAAPDPLSVEGVNDRLQLAALSKAHNRRVCEHWMLNGVTILDPDTTWIEDDVELAQDVTVLPGSFLKGHTVIGQNAVVGPYTTLIDATVDAEAVVERSRVQGSHIGRAANIGPWTYMRPGNELGEETKAGAFVEMKKAHIGNGTKWATPNSASTPTSAVARSPPTMTACTRTARTSARTCTSAPATCSSRRSRSATASPPVPVRSSATPCRTIRWSIPKTHNTSSRAGSPLGSVDPMTAVQSSIDAVRVAAVAADRMKAADIEAFDVSDLLAITDIMMVATAMNERQVIGVAEEVEKDVYLKCGHLSPRSREGVSEGQWVLLDYGDFIIHIMHQDAREYYRLERLWRDCPVVELPLEHPETTGDESADNGSDGDDAGEADE